MVLRDTSELRQPLAKEAMAVLTAIDVDVTDYVRFIVRNRQMRVNTVVLVDIVVDCVVIGTQNHRFVAFLCYFFVYVLEILSNQKFHSSVARTDECRDWWFV